MTHIIFQDWPIVYDVTSQGEMVEAR